MHAVAVVALEWVFFSAEWAPVRREIHTVFLLSFVSNVLPVPVMARLLQCAGGTDAFFIFAGATVKKKSRNTVSVADVA